MGELILVSAGPLDSAGIAVHIVVEEDVRPVVGETDTHRQPSAIVRRADVQSVGRLSQQGGLVGSVARIDVGCLRCGVAVIGAQSKAGQQTRQIGKVLLEVDLHPGDVCRTRVGCLNHLEPNVWPRGGHRKQLHDGVGKTFVEKAPLDGADRLQVVGVEDIEVVSMLGLQSWVANGKGRRNGRAVEAGGGSQELWIGARECPRINQAQIAVVAQAE